MTVGECLKELRRRKARELGRRLTQAEVAEASGLSVSSLQKWETDAQAPSWENALKLARYYDTTPEAILGGSEMVREQSPTYRDQRGPESLSRAEVDQRLAEILTDAALSVDEKSTLMLDLALVLRADALRDRDRTARIEAELAARRGGTLADVKTRVMPKRRVTREDLEGDRRTG